jgi:hypothetical protein
MTIEAIALLLSQAASLLGFLAIVFYFFQRKDDKKTFKISILASSGAVIAVVSGLASMLGSSSVNISAAASCQPSKDYPPLSISCINESVGATQIEWSVDGRPASTSDEKFDVSVEKPGIYIIRLTAVRNSFFRHTSSVSEYPFIVKDRPRSPDIRIRRLDLAETSHQQSTGTKIFRAAPGYKIRDAFLEVKSSNRASAQIINRTDSQVTVLYNLEPTPRFINFRIEKSRSWLSGSLVLTEEK